MSDAWLVGLMSQTHDEQWRHSLQLLKDAMHLQEKQHHELEKPIMCREYIPLLNDMLERREAWMRFLEMHLLVAHSVANVMSFMAGTHTTYYSRRNQTISQGPGAQ